MLRRRNASTARASRRFNPHPARGPGAANSPIVAPSASMTFQSSPGPGAGCCHRVRGHVRRYHGSVSILTRPGGRVLLEAAKARKAAALRVSILTRPGGRVLPDLMRRPSAATRCFNPHPARGPGAAHTWGCVCHRRSRFNPHPARGPGAAMRDAEATHNVTKFQSSPGPGAGCCGTSAWMHRAGLSGFNPHPARGPGAAGSGSSRSDSSRTVSILTRPGGRVLPGSRGTPETTAAATAWFQSSPGPGAGCCNPTSVTHPTVNLEVSILTRPGGRVLPREEWARVRTGRVSILTRPGGRVLLQRRDRHRQHRDRVSILTRPGGRVLLCEHGSGVPVLIVFQSSPGPGAGCCVWKVARQ